MTVPLHRRPWWFRSRPITIAKDPKSQTIGQGGTAKFTITVTNTGDVAKLTDVVVTDPRFDQPAITPSPGRSLWSASEDYSCTKTV